MDGFQPREIVGQKVEENPVATKLGLRKYEHSYTFG